MGDHNDSTPTQMHAGARRWPYLLARMLALALLWLILAEATWSSWLVGAPACLLATAASARLAPPGRWSWHPGAAARFAAFFVRYSIWGGIDVARRALQPSMPLAPGFVSYPLRLSIERPAAVFFANTISLLPGTLCADIAPDHLTVHVIDQNRPVLDDLRHLEERVAAIFGEPLRTPPPAVEVPHG